jgi:hypothetical protein
LDEFIDENCRDVVCVVGRCGTEIRDQDGRVDENTLSRGDPLLESFPIQPQSSRSCRTYSTFSSIV